MIRKTTIYCFLAIMALYGNLSGQITDTLRIEEVSVSAPAPIGPGETRTIIDSISLNRYAAQSLSELLSENSSMFMKSYGRGALASPSFRGMSPSHTKVSWNGLELNTPMLGMVDFSLIPVYFTDEVNLVHGNNQVPGMTGATGGVVELNNTIDWNQKVSISANQGIGSFGSIDDFFRLSLGNNRVQSSTRLMFNHSDNDFRYRNTDVIASVDPETGRRGYPVTTNKDASYGLKGLLQQIGYRPGSNSMLSLNLWLQDSERSLPALSTSEQGEAAIQNRQKDQFLRTALKYQYFLGNTKLEFFQGMNHSKLLFNSRTSVSGMNEYYWLNRSVGDVLSIDQSLRLRQKVGPKDEFEVLVAMAWHTVNTLDIVSDKGYDKNRKEIRTYAGWTRNCSENFRIRTGYSQDLVDREFMKPGISFRTEWDALDNELIRVHLGFDASGKYPGMNDLYMVPGGNPELKPEYARSVETGIAFNKKAGKPGFTSSLVFYRSDIENWILWLPGFRGYWEPSNVKLVKTGGMELKLCAEAKVSGIQYIIRGDYAFTRSLNFGERNKISDQSYGKQLPYVPLHSANLNAHFERRGWFISYTWNYYSERFTTSSNQASSRRDYLYPYFMNNARAGKIFEAGSLRAEASLAVYNLFNEQYRSVLQRPMPGRNFHLLIRVNWKNKRE